MKETADPQRHSIATLMSNSLSRLEADFLELQQRKGKLLQQQPTDDGYWPLNMLCRLGMHTGLLQNALANSTPSAASRSRCGV